MRPTAAGWAFFFLLLWVPLAAIATANNFLFILFAMLIGLGLVSRRLGRKNMRAVELRRLFPEEIFAETPFRLRYEIGTAFQPWGAAALTLSEDPPLETEAGATGLTRSAPGEPQELGALYSIADRGDHAIGPTRVRSTFPFGLAAYTRLFGPNQSILVFPRVDSVHAEIPFQLGNIGKGLEQVDPFGTIPYHFREYVAGDPYKHIEWKMSARSGRLITRVHSEEGAREMVVRLPVAASERTVSRAASLVVCLAEKGVPVSLAGPGLRTEAGTQPEHVRNLLTILARWDNTTRAVEPSDGPRADTVEIDEVGEFRWTLPGDANG